MVNPPESAPFKPVEVPSPSQVNIDVAASENLQGRTTLDLQVHQKTVRLGETPVVDEPADQVPQNSDNEEEELTEEEKKKRAKERKDILKLKKQVAAERQEKAEWALCASGRPEIKSAGIDKPRSSDLKSKQIETKSSDATATGMKLREVPLLVCVRVYLIL